MTEKAKSKKFFFFKFHICWRQLFGLFKVNRWKWLTGTVKIKVANKQAKINVGSSLVLHIFCFILIDYA